MIRYCLTAAVLMIYPYLTNAESVYIGWGNRSTIKRELKKDAPLFGSIGEAIGKSLYGKRPDILCDVLGDGEKQLICDEMMKHMVARENIIQVGSFLDIVPTPPVPQLADSTDPHNCNRIPIAELGFSKRMFWCQPKKYIEIGGVSVIGEKVGFFCAGSPSRKDYVFAFIQSEKNKKEVIPRALMYEVDLLKNKRPACLGVGCMKAELTSSPQPHCTHDPLGIELQHFD